MHGSQHSKTSLIKVLPAGQQKQDHHSQNLSKGAQYIQGPQDT